MNNKGFYMDYQKLVNTYTQALGSNNYHMVVDLFSDDAIIEAPRFGQKNARDFYQELLEKIQYKAVTLNQLFPRTFNPACFAAHIRLEAIKPVITEECIDVFTVNEQGKITKLIIFCTPKK